MIQRPSLSILALVAGSTLACGADDGKSGAVLTPVATGGVTSGGGSDSGVGGSGVGGSEVGGSEVGGSGVGGSGGGVGVGGDLATGGSGTTTGGAGTVALTSFSFFMTSWAGMARLAGTEAGFGGDLRYGQADGLSGADRICTELAEASMPGSGVKGWRAFLSVASGPDGQPVHAIDRIGTGPWYDRLGRVVAMSLADIPNLRPTNADPTIVNDLPNEYGVPNHDPDGTGFVDNHDVLTGSDTAGRLATSSGSGWGMPTGGSPTCNDWTSAVGSTGQPMVGHSWPGDGMGHWLSAHAAPGCAAGGVSAEDLGFGPGEGTINCDTVGCQGGYGAIYCFALQQ